VAENNAVKEKRQVAFLSVLAAVFITGFKVVVGLMTGSLGILSEALHSALDLVAALVTLFAVRISDKPPDLDHHYGHGKVENLSALFETVLLLGTCVWIIYEATSRLMSGKVEIEVNVWSYIVVITSIIVDISRSRALKKAAVKHNSQALEADALHFSTDIWSSAVVLLGLICANFGFFYADSIAALLVAVIVLTVSYRLGKRSIDVLLDRTPTDTLGRINDVLKEIPEVLHYHDVRIRTSGADTFVEINIHVDPQLSIEKAHEISHQVQHTIQDRVDRCKVHVHEEPNVVE